MLSYTYAIVLSNWGEIFSLDTVIILEISQSLTNVLYDFKVNDLLASFTIFHSTLNDQLLRVFFIRLRSRPPIIIIDF